MCTLHTLDVEASSVIDQTPVQIDAQLTVQLQK